MDDILEYVTARMKEPSTWASLGIFVTGIGWNIAPEYWQAIAGIGMGIGGALGFVLRERKKTTTAEIKAVVAATVEPSAMK